MHKSTGNAIWFDDAVEKIGLNIKESMEIREILLSVIKNTNSIRKLTGENLARCIRPIDVLRPEVDNETKDGVTGG